MYDIKVIRGNKKNTLANYINTLHVFSENLGEAIIGIYVQDYLFLPKIQEGRGERGEGAGEDF